MVSAGRSSPYDLKRICGAGSQRHITLDVCNQVNRLHRFVLHGRVVDLRAADIDTCGIDQISAPAPVDRHVEGVVEMVLDATANCHAPVSRERLFGWHAISERCERVRIPA